MKIKLSLRSKANPAVLPAWMNGPADSWTSSSLTGLRSWRDLLLLHKFWQFCPLVCDQQWRCCELCHASPIVPLPPHHDLPSFTFSHGCQSLHTAGVLPAGGQRCRSDYWVAGHPWYCPELHPVSSSTLSRQHQDTRNILAARVCVSPWRGCMIRVSPLTAGTEDRKLDTNQSECFFVFVFSFIRSQAFIFFCSHNPKCGLVY